MIINVNKPVGISSFGALRVIKNAYYTKYHHKKTKVGHAGTLDPLASGVLIVLTEVDTKKQDKLMHQDKEYLAKIAFGAKSKTYDLEGELEVNAIPFSLEELIDRLNTILPKYIGNITQTVPPYSAVKVAGERLYKLARRNNQPIELPRKQVTVYSLTIENIESVFVPKANMALPVLTVRIGCGSGFYVRAFAHDLGEELGIGGVLISLVRTKVGAYTLAGALELNDQLILDQI